MLAAFRCLQNSTNTFGVAITTFGRNNRTLYEVVVAMVVIEITSGKWYSGVGSYVSATSVGPETCSSSCCCFNHLHYVDVFLINRSLINDTAMGLQL